MAVSLLNHSTTETAINSTRQFKNHVDTVAETLRYYSHNVSPNWQGTSYQRFLEVVAEIQSHIQAITEQTSSANNRLDNGQTSAAHDEHEAQRREEEARQQVREDFKC